MVVHTQCAARCVIPGTESACVLDGRSVVSLFDGEKKKNCVLGSHCSCGALGGFLYRRVQPTGVLERIQAVGAPSGSAAPLASASDPTAVGAHLHLLGAVRELSTKFLSIEQDMRAIGVAHNSLGGSNDDAVDDNSVQVCFPKTRCLLNSCALVPLVAAL